MNVISNIFGWIRAWRRERILDERERTKTLSAELDKLAELMDEVLKVTNADGHIQHDKLPELDLIEKRVWNRWVSILATNGYAMTDPDLRSEVEKCIRVAHAAPGAYIEEIYLAKIGIAKGYVPAEVRERFAKAVYSLRDLTTRMRLNA